MEIANKSTQTTDWSEHKPVSSPLMLSRLIAFFVETNYDNIRKRSWKKFFVDIVKVVQRQTSVEHSSVKWQAFILSSMLEKDAIAYVVSFCVKTRGSFTEKEKDFKTFDDTVGQHSPVSDIIVEVSAKKKRFQTVWLWS